MSEPFVGQLALFPYSFAPVNWQDCAGQIVPISQYTALFSLLGTTFGGNGTSNFGLPDLQGRVAIGTDFRTYPMGEEGGAETVAITQSTMASHQHTLNASTTAAAANAPQGNVLANPEKGSVTSKDRGNIYNPGNNNVSLAIASIGSSGGTGTPHNNLQPSLVLRYCICMVGVFPPRG